MKIKKIALVGQHGCGKSALFDVLADLKTPSTGATIEIRQTDIDIFGETVRVLDLPGIYSLNPYDPAEKIAIDYLLNEDIDLIINVVNSAFLPRSLELTIELLELGLPVVTALNMLDEAEKRGLKIDVEKLSKELDIDVVPTIARQGKGARKLIEACRKNFSDTKSERKIPEFTYHIENKINELSEVIDKADSDKNLSSRFWAIKAIENPEIVPNRFFSKIESTAKQFEQEIEKQHKTDAYESISYERHHIAMKIAESTSKIESNSFRSVGKKLDDILLHPLFGRASLLLFFALYFFAIFVVGDFLSSLVDAPISKFSEVFAPIKDSSPFWWHTINGAYMGAAGVLGIVLPYFLPLVFITAYFEETGYLTRIAFLIDGLLHKIGLHGKSVAPFILGFGCTVPALYATRMIENKRDRIITGILTPFVPCSARIAVIFALTAAFAGPLEAMLIFIIVGVIIALSGKVLSKIWSKPIGLILEIPDLKIPSITNTLKTTWYKINDFIRDAIIFLIGGSVVLGWIEYFDLAKYVNSIFAPIVDGILGLPEALGSTLVFGFFRKELIIVMANQALSVPTLAQLPMTTNQVLTFVLFVTLYFPCFTTLVVLWKEFGAKIAAATSVFSVLVATVASYILKTVASFWRF